MASSNKYIKGLHYLLDDVFLLGQQGGQNAIVDRSYFSPRIQQMLSPEEMAEYRRRSFMISSHLLNRLARDYMFNTEDSLAISGGAVAP
jgi:hypothetical protein